MWGRSAPSSVAGAVVGALVSLASCAPGFPRGLLTVAGDGADYPIMLSQAPTGAAGRKITAFSGTSIYQQRAGNSSYTQQAESEMPAWMKLNAQVLRADKWMQIDRLEFHATNVTALTTWSALRKLAMDGTAYR